MRELIKLREQPSYLKEAIRFFQEKWGNTDSNPVYDDCLKHSLESNKKIPQWYLIVDEGKIIAGCGLISNDFISRMDLTYTLGFVHFMLKKNFEIKVLLVC